MGDLIDRGPDSFGTAALVRETWFHAVLGNHELMLLNYLGHYSSRMHSRKAYASGAGEWIRQAMAREPLAVRRLARRLAELPLAIHVEDELPFNVMHADLHPLGIRPEALFVEEALPVHHAERATFSRVNIDQGVCDRAGARRGEARPPTVLEHRQFAY